MDPNWEEKESQAKNQLVGDGAGGNGMDCSVMGKSTGYSIGQVQWQSMIAASCPNCDYEDKQENAIMMHSDLSQLNQFSYDVWLILDKLCNT